MRPREEPHLSLLVSFGEERKVAVRTKAVAMPLVPHKEKWSGPAWSCGQPLGVVAMVEEALLFPYGSGPSSTEFPVPSSRAGPS